MHSFAVVPPLTLAPLTIEQRKKLCELYLSFYARLRNAPELQGPLPIALCAFADGEQIAEQLLADPEVRTALGAPVSDRSLIAWVAAILALKGDA